MGCVHVLKATPLNLMDLHEKGGLRFTRLHVAPFQHAEEVCLLQGDALGWLVFYKCSYRIRQENKTPFLFTNKLHYCYEQQKVTSRLQSSVHLHMSKPN